MKKYITKLLKKNKRNLNWLFVCRGPGETGQARSLARYAANKGKKVSFAIHQEKNLHFLKSDKDFKVFIAENPASLEQLIKRENPDVLLLFNSKMWGGDFLEKPSFKKPSLIIAVDSNWLFNDEKYFPVFQAIKWADKYFVIFPKKIYELGLKQNGGDFSISESFSKKIIPIGLIPSYKKPHKKEIGKIRKIFGIEKDEKFVFSYFSGFGAGHRVFAFNNLIEAISHLVEKGKKIKVLYLGPTEEIDPEKLNRPWLIKREGLPTDEYFNVLASSDLIFQHQGMVTLAQAISAQIPVIANVSVLDAKHLPMIHFWEVNPFKRAGACEMFSKNDQPEKIAEKIEQLLYNEKSRKEMIKNQKSIFEQGEKTAFNIITRLCP